jgi:antitoxin ParD1/3/4
MHRRLWARPSPQVTCRKLTPAPPGSASNTATFFSIRSWTPRKLLRRQVAHVAVLCHGQLERESAVAPVGRWIIGTSIHLSLTDELREFIDANSGGGTLYATPSEFVRDLLRQQKQRQEAASVRDGILAGYHDAIQGRTHAFQGDLLGILKKASANQRR